MAENDGRKIENKFRLSRRTLRGWLIVLSVVWIYLVCWLIHIMVRMS